MATSKDKFIAVAQKLVEKGQYEKAVKEYLKVVAEDPKDVRIWLKVGDLHVKLRRFSEACEAYLKAGEHYREQGFFRKAIAIYKQIVNLDPRLIEVHQRLAEMCREQGLIPDALVHYEHVAAAYHREGRTTEALDVLQLMVDIDPENVPSRIKLAELYLKAQMTAQATTEFRQAAERLKAQQRIDDFMKVAERLLFLAPGNLDLARELAERYIERGDPRRALPKLQQCFKANPRDVEALKLLAQAFSALGQIAKTVSVLKELARIHGDNRDLARRDEVYRKVLEIAPGDPDALAALRQPAAAPQPAASPAARARPGEAHPGMRGTSARPATETPVSVPATSRLAPGGMPLTARVTPRPAPSTATPPAVPAAARARSPAAAEMPVAARGQPVATPTTANALHPDEIDLVPEVPTPRRHSVITPPPRSARPGETDPGRESSAPRRHSVVVAPPAHAAVGDPAQDIARILEETEVYRKYGLHELAAEHVQQVFKLAPQHLEARELLASLYAQLGRVDEAVGQLWLLYRQVGAAPRGEGYLREILKLHPEEAQAAALLAQRPAGGRTGALAEGGEMSQFEPAVEPAIEIEDLDGDLLVEDVGSEDLADDDIPLVFDAEEAVPETAAHARTFARDGEIEDRFGANLGTTTEMSGTSEGQEGRGELIDLTEDLLESETAEIPPDFDVSPASPLPIEEELERFDYFVQQGMGDEARALLRELTARFPGHPLLELKLRDLEPPGEGEELERLGYGGQERSVRARIDPGIAELDSSDTELNIPAEDFDTHYDLGIAYKEMGLLDEAVAEFRLVMQDPSREVQCHLMLGLVFLEQGRVSDAINQFKKGLYAERIQEMEELALYYELGNAYERLADLREALYYFEKVFKRDANFRDVGERIQRLHGGPKETLLAPVKDDIDQAFDGLVTDLMRVK